MISMSKSSFAITAVVYLPSKIVVQKRIYRESTHVADSIIAFNVEIRFVKHVLQPGAKVDRLLRFTEPWI